MGEDAVKCTAPCAHGCGSDLAESDAVSPSGSVQDESDWNGVWVNFRTYMSVNNVSISIISACVGGIGRSGCSARFCCGCFSGSGRPGYVWH